MCRVYAPPVAPHPSSCNANIRSLLKLALINEHFHSVSSAVALYFDTVSWHRVKTKGCFSFSELEK